MSGHRSTGPGPLRAGTRADLVGPVLHGDGPGARIAATARSLVGSGAASRELADRLAGAQRPVSTGRRIVVVSPRGGSGRTTLTAAMATLFAVHRGDPVLAVDAAVRPGSLAWRLAVDVDVPLPSTARAVLGPQGRDLATLGAVLPRARSGLWCLVGAPGDADELHLVRNATRALSRLAAVTVTDTGEDLWSPFTGSVLEDGHTVVLATPATADGVVSTLDALARLHAGGWDVAARTVVVLNAVDRQAQATLKVRAAVSALGAGGVTVLPLPHDRHLAAGTPLVASRLAVRTHRALSGICSAALASAVAV